MAEFAIGLTKTVVESTVSRVKSAIQEEAELKDKLQYDLEFITAEFQMMQSFLNVAKECPGNEVLQTWVRQLRHLAFDVEDWVEFVVHMDKKSVWYCRMVSWAPCLARALCLKWAPGFAETQHLDQAAVEINLLKAKVENVSQRYMRYNFIGDSVSKPIMPAEQLATASPSAFHILHEVWKAAGKQYGPCNLQKLITSEGGNDLQVISVWGSRGGDLGTTSIIMEAYCDRDICREFKTRAWVKLAHPFNLDKFLMTLLTQLCKSSDQADVGYFLERMKQAVAPEDNCNKAELMMQFMKEKKYLVVLEDVSTVVEWDDIKMHLPDSKNGSRIVVSTHDIGIAFMCTGKPYQVSELRRFPDSHLFVPSSER